MIKNFKSYNESKKGLIKLSEEDKKYFWSKIEYSKKKRATEKESDMFKNLTSKGDSEISEDIMIKYLNSLEYSIKKQMMDSDKKFRNSNATSIQSKIPNKWLGVKYSSIKAKRKRDEKKDEKKKD